MSKRILHTIAIPCVAFSLAALGLAVSPMSFAEDNETNSEANNDGEVMQQPGATNGSVPSDPQAPDPQDEGTRPENQEGEAGFGTGAVGMPEEKLPDEQKHGEQEHDD